MVFQCHALVDFNCNFTSVNHASLISKPHFKNFSEWSLVTTKLSPLVSSSYLVNISVFAFRLMFLYVKYTNKANLMAKTNYYLKSTPNGKGEQLIILSFSYSGSRLRYSTGQTIEEKYWNQRNNMQGKITKVKPH